MNSQIKITGIYLSNFQSILNPTFIKLDKPCFFYGPNSAGKSSILDALEIFSKFHTEDTVEKYFRKYARDEAISPTIGVEFTSELITSSITKDRGDSQWWRKKVNDSYYDYPHQSFFEEINGKSVQIQVGSYGASFSVAIENEPLFEIGNTSWNVDEYGQTWEGSESNFNDEDLADVDACLNGYIKIYKKSPFYKFLDWHLRDFLIKPDELFRNKRWKNLLGQFNPYYDLAVEDNNEEFITIRGISFSIDNQWYSRSHSYVFVDYCADLIFEYEYSSKDLDVDESNSVAMAEARKYLEDFRTGKYFNWDGEKSLSKLKNIAEYFGDFVYGFILQINKGIRFSHVKGNRGLLDSRKLFAFHTHDPGEEPLAASSLAVPNVNYIDPQNTFMDNYASFLLNELGDKDDFPYFYNPGLKIDFVNLALSRYLPSLSDYSITAKGYKVSHHLDSRVGRLVYLFLKYRSKTLGFQDVGSGISYLFPILTALWGSKLCFIEQPELHLHPAGQCEIADVLIAANKMGVVSVVESHSEHLLLRLMRRIRETTDGYLIREELKIKPDDFRIYYFIPRAEGYTDVKEIRLDKYGELLNSWPGGFFSERERELFGE